MHICIIGAGVSGWLTANYLNSLLYINKITVIGSPDIPPIGVGESTTLPLLNIQKKFGINLKDFITNSSAAVKYGVYYQDWGENDFIHFFKSNVSLKKAGLTTREYIKLLGDKPQDLFIHDIYGKYLWQEGVKKNQIFQDNIPHETFRYQKLEYPFSFHFDAGKYINFLKQNALKSPKINFISDQVKYVNFKRNYIDNLVLKKNQTNLKADYYINTTGQSLNEQNIFYEEYNSLNDILLTNKAAVFPLKYTDKKTQFHPYTIAKTMKYGWRWITPTWERIGTGYVFSDRYVSEDEAINEFLEDIGDKTLKPKIVDFTPRVNKETFKINSCSIGMANGFLEPLDAPGLTLTAYVLGLLERLFNIYNKDIKSQPNNLCNNFLYQEGIKICNKQVEKEYKFWTTFILNQYKTCHRNDTPFWVDQKNILWPQWDLAVSNLEEFGKKSPNPENEYETYTEHENMMLAQTLAARNIKYPTSYSINPNNFNKLFLPETLPPTIHHLDWIQSFYKK